MARPIKETPILYGEDARRFEARMKERRRISAEERARINADYELVLGMLKRGEELKQQRHAATVLYINLRDDCRQAGGTGQRKVVRLWG